MSKKILIPAIALAACAAVSGSASAMVLGQPQGWYGGVHGGFNAPAKSGGLDNGYDVGAQIGYRYTPFRVEAAYTFYRNNLSGGHLNTHTVMGNLYYDFMPSSTFNPYVGAGIGWAHFDAKASSEGETIKVSTNEFAYQGIVGIAYNINDHFAVDANYHYLRWSNSSGAYYNLFNLGVNYSF